MEEINQSIELHILDANLVTKRQFNEMVNALQDSGLSDAETITTAAALTRAAAINFRTGLIVQLAQSTQKFLHEWFRSFEEKLDEFILLMEDRHD